MVTIGLMVRLEAIAGKGQELASFLVDALPLVEDEPETVAFLREVQHRRVFGASASPEGVRYGDDAVEWFDMSLISRHGRVRADELKLLNRRTYQEMIFAGLGYRFENEPYVLPSPATSSLYGDVAIAPIAGLFGVAQDVLSERVQADGAGNFSFSFSPRLPLPGTRYEIAMTARKAELATESRLELFQKQN